MTNDVIPTDAPLPVDNQVLSIIKKRYDLNPQQKELVFELSGFGVVLNNKNDYLAIVTVLDGLKDKAGIEYVIEALPQVVQRLPNLIYLVIGATHPTVLRDEGEEYRRMLMRKVYELGLASHVRFYNRYLPLKELLQFLQ